MVPRGKRQIKAFFIAIALATLAIGVTWWRG
jgi:hypothetical protein